MKSKYDISHVGDITLDPHNKPCPYFPAIYFLETSFGLKLALLARLLHQRA